jgi:hypothetical protein
MASAVATVFALVVGVYLILFMGVDGIAYLFLLVAIFAGSVAWLFQPGTLLYATQDRFGQRTMFGTRYEVSSAAIAAVRIGYLTFEGSHLPTIVFEDAHGRCLMRHYNVRYAQSDLDRLTAYAGLPLGGGSAAGS